MVKSKFWPWLWAICLFSSAALAAGPGPKPAPQAPKTVKATGPAPKIACDKPSFNFGSVSQGDDVKHVFSIKNVGKGVLKIERARGG